MTRFYRMDRLIGGPRHLKRVSPSAMDRDEISFALPNVPPQFIDSYAVPDSVIHFREARYRLRKAAFGPNRVLMYYAHSRLSDAEAADRLWNFLLDRAGIEEVR